MSFHTDKQTLDDLNIFGKRGNDSVYALFNRTCTTGGAEVLNEMFRYPLPDVTTINKRSEIIQYFRTAQAVFPFKSELFDAVEPYLKNTDERTRLSHEDRSMGRKFTNLVGGGDAGYITIYEGVNSVIEILNSFRDFLHLIETALKTPYHGDMDAIARLLGEPGFDPLFTQKRQGKPAYNAIATYDNIIRFRHRDKIKKILGYIYDLDVYIAVARVAAQRGFIFPKALNKEQRTVKLEGVYHPLLVNAVGNSIEITPESNIIFLTGANMAGKSTFMKSLGIAMFLSHMGFPVAAKKMEFSVQDAIYTTINLADNLGMGVSHFYVEVLRIKKMAAALGTSKNVFIIFDELFRGTNVKDACDATIAVTAAFALKKNCMFLVSTHIIEAGEVLKKRCDNISFRYLPTRMNKNIPEYTYTLEPGITGDRHGMVIINNEGILDILKRGRTKREPV